MRIEVQDDYRIAVELTKDDMSELDITYEDLDYSNIETRRVLWTVLDEASHTIGRDINLSEKMLIEAIPGISGGCIIYFTVLPKSQGAPGVTRIVKRDEGTIICEIERLDDIFLACALLKKRGYTEKSELYMNGGKYRLVLYPDPADETVLENVLCEYGDVVHKNKLHALSRMEEYWDKIAAPDAVSKF